MIWALEMYTLWILAIILVSLAKGEVFIASKCEYLLAEAMPLSLVPIRMSMID